MRSWIPELLHPLLPSKPFPSSHLSPGPFFQACTGDEALLIITSGSVEHSHRPYIATTSRHVDNFCSEVLKLIPDDVGAKMDGFMVTRIEGVARTHVQVLLQMKHAVSQLILQKLCESDILPSRLKN